MQLRLDNTNQLFKHQAPPVTCSTLAR